MYKLKSIYNVGFSSNCQYFHEAIELTRGLSLKTVFSLNKEQGAPNLVCLESS